MTPQEILEALKELAYLSRHKGEKVDEGVDVALRFTEEEGIPKYRGKFLILDEDLIALADMLNNVRLANV